MCLQNNHILDLDSLGKLYLKRNPVQFGQNMVQAKWVLGLEPGNSGRPHFGQKLREAWAVGRNGNSEVSIEM